jgi:hypothetical protein
MHSNKNIFMEDFGMRPDFKEFDGVGLAMLAHSAKGSTWEEHKYIKRIDGTYLFR